ncbi:FAD-binding oxidoreductase [Actinopolymorpha alba]|uniref:FAD-binding oxidoreductase n=1 Tax=Actinopolymorpha alba TaxID=533267 RepID=UPI00035E0AF7|nr:FAD-binding oxidoreductase [Actinopolymorpha alba]
MSDVQLRTASGQPTRVPEDDVRTLESRLHGRLVSPADTDYDEARAVWNGMIDRRPALIARCTGVADVIAAVTFAREHDLLVGVRGGGHNVSGVAVCDDGLVVDLSLMKGVRVDPIGRTVQAQGGVTIGELDHETQAFALAVPMGLVSATGIAGLTLGGGFGWLRRAYGLSCDSLVSVDVVTADGQLVTASARDHAELFWAIKGGGGNFGVVTSFEFRAYPVGPEVFFAVVVHRGSDAGAALRSYRDWAATAPDDVTAFAVLWHGPEIEEIPAEHHGQPILILAAVHHGDPADGERALRQLRAFGSPIADLSGSTPYLQVQQFFDADYPAHELRYYWKSRYVRDLPDQLIDLLVELNAASASPRSTLDVWQLGGALSRVGVDETAFGGRSAPFMIAIEANWQRPEDDRANIAWGRQVYGVLEPYAAGGEYVNFPGFYEDGAKVVRDTFGANLDRLVAVKNRYDPTNLFRLNHNIQPS